ncbi:hypothetical protein A5717_26270 [Mycolicibacterium porcinum]|uniref:helix-turn-helix domain-containing protein n=1 Tax=Mycolicibacterium porcinum TaxID=39693 RepID=UPI00080B13F0|nr:helix-turn-helix domain-containing protein [Mycolicibacterium porcinum]OCB09281.1 hypothetical protein A5717_26270 [Mycolicibacterium porcinum]
MARTQSLEEVAAEIGAPSAEWLAKMIRANRVPARKIGRSWRMTPDDIDAALENLRNKAPRPGDSRPEPAPKFDPTAPVPRVLSLTPTSRRRAGA